MFLVANDVKGKLVFVGIDVHKRSYAVSVQVGDSLHRNITMPGDPVALCKWLRKNFVDCVIKTAYEAGFSGFALHRLLTEAGIENIVVNPASIPVAANSRVKTDKRDANKIREELRKGSLRAIRIPPVSQELDRLLPRTRAQLVVQKTRIGNQIKSKLLMLGFIEASDDRVVCLRWLDEIEKLDLPEELSFCIGALAGLYREVHQQILAFERQLKVQAAASPALEAIYRSVPGVGAISARVLATELGDMSQFANERRLFSFTGLTPSEFSSGDRIRKGGITHQGNTHVRHCLIEIAWRAISLDQNLRSRYEKLKFRCGAKKAIVAIARQLVGKIRACLRNGQNYRLVKVA